MAKVLLWAGCTGGMLFSTCNTLVRVPFGRVDVDHEQVLVDLPGVLVDVTVGHVLVEVPGVEINIRDHYRPYHHYPYHH